MNAVAYLRVSTEEQAAEGVSLEAQEAKVRAWCVVNEYALLDVHVDAGLSGGRADNRPALQAAVAQACRAHAALVVHSLSRLARSTKDTLAIAERLDRAGADLVSLSERIDTTTAAGKMVFRMLAVLAEFERDQISERTKAAMAHLRRTHRRISRVTPFGYDLDEGGDTLTPNPREQEAIALMRSMRASGKSLRQIAATLDEAGVATKSGRGWTAQTIRGILDRECA